MACLQFSLVPKCLQSIFPAGDDLSLWDTTNDSTPSNDSDQNSTTFTAQHSFIESIRAGIVTILAVFSTTNIETTDTVPDTQSCETHSLHWWPSSFE
jgi:hypothetical protein